MKNIPHIFPINLFISLLIKRNKERIGKECGKLFDIFLTAFFMTSIEIDKENIRKEYISFLMFFLIPLST